MTLAASLLQPLSGSSSLVKYRNRPTFMQRLNIYTILLVSLVFFVCSFRSNAQTDSGNNRTRVAVFTPLYLDSVFDASGNYKPGKNFPKYLNAGLEFYEGVQLAIDSLEKENANLDIHIFDTRSGKKLETLLQDETVKDMDLFIGYVNVNSISICNGSAEIEPGGFRC